MRSVKAVSRRGKSGRRRIDADGTMSTMIAGEHTRLDARRFHGHDQAAFAGAITSAITSETSSNRTSRAASAVSTDTIGHTWLVPTRGTGTATGFSPRISAAKSEFSPRPNLSWSAASRSSACCRTHPMRRSRSACRRGSRSDRFQAGRPRRRKTAG